MHAMGGDSFILGLFQPDIAVNRSGQILQLQSDDFDAFAKLAKSWAGSRKSRDRSGRSGKDYRIPHSWSCRPFTILHIPTTDGLDKTSVYGFSKDTQGLEEGGGLLPETLWELLGLVEEANPANGPDVDQKVLQRVEKISRHLQ
ncbi:hypothetical protein LTS18_000078 [Coniosporium uncinatum]|uniref:Uncharacterized protein n=1 Tax=Coniosporium uncinatum TaxID=93489 RepID=A0ACC3DDC9_9PEZI|nr:hypothetical protein LTS18_000078 [Coniosporium uncinatum]